jgi:hypothetical protein
VDKHKIENSYLMHVGNFELIENDVDKNKIENSYLMHVGNFELTISMYDGPVQLGSVETTGGKF